MPFATFSSSSRSYGSDSNFTVVSNTNMPNYRYCRLKQLTMYRTMYNVTDSTSNAPSNNVLPVVIATDPSDELTWTYFNVQIPQGNYDVSSMLSTLQSTLNAQISGASISASTTFSVSSLTSKLSIAISGGYQIAVLPISVLTDNYGLNLMLGFTRTSSSGFGTSITAPRVINLNRYLNLYLISNIVPGKSFSSMGDVLKTGQLNTANGSLIQSIIGTVPINVPFADVISFQETENEFLPYQINLMEFTFRIVDDQGQDIDLNGTPVNIVLECVNSV